MDGSRSMKGKHLNVDRGGKNFLNSDAAEVMRAADSCRDGGILQ
jgi:hypothetical protein